MAGSADNPNTARESNSSVFRRLLPFSLINNIEQEHAFDDSIIMILDDIIKEGNVLKIKELIMKEHADKGDEHKEKVLFEMFYLALRYNQRDVLHYVYNESDENSRKLFTNICFKTQHVHNWIGISYDSQCGNLHWSKNTTYHNERARILEKLQKDLQNLQNNNNKKSAYVEYLIKFNSFQTKLCAKLTELEAKSVNNDIEDLKNILIAICDIYKEYSIYRNITSDLAYVKYMDVVINNFYYNKIDFTVALIILDNIYLLKKICRDVPQEIESELYNFLYHSNNDWFTLLPKYVIIDRYIDGSPGFELKIKFYTAGLIHEKRRYFIKCIDKFQNDLRTISCVNQTESKMIDNSIKLPYLKDEFSLKKIVYYLDGMLSVDLKTDKNRSLIIMRIIQIIGEYTKYSEESPHLSPVTLALLQAELPMETIKQFKELRNFISKVDEGRLRARIEIKTNTAYTNILDNVLEDLQKLKEVFKNIILIHKPRLVKEFMKESIVFLDLKLKDSSHSKEERVLLGYAKKELTTRLQMTVLEIRNTMSYYIEVIRNHLQYFNTTISAEEQRWKTIKGLIEFIVFDGELFENHPFEIEECNMNILSLNVKRIINQSSIQVDKMTSILNVIEERVKRIRLPAVNTNQNVKYNFSGIEALKSNLKKIASIKKQDTSTENYNSFLCLCQRITELKKALEETNDPNNDAVLVLNYTYNRKFRMEIEAIMQDIFNMFHGSNQKALLVKFSNLFAGYNLRNFLSHGNPLLELAGEVLDETDISKELINQALDLVNNHSFIEAFRQLMEQNVDLIKIKDDNINDLPKDVQDLVSEFKKMNQQGTKYKWHHFLKLVLPQYILDKCLHDAIITKDMDKILKAIESGADVDSFDKTGFTCLHRAAVTGHKQKIQILLDNKADVNKANKDKNQNCKTPLHYAASKNHRNAVEMLLNHGADLNMEDRQGKKPIDYAKNPDLKKYLSTYVRAIASTSSV